MDSDSDSYYEGNSEIEKEVAGPLHINVQVNLEKSPESPQPASPSFLLPPLPIPVGELTPVWELGISLQKPMCSTSSNGQKQRDKEMKRGVWWRS